MVYGGRGVGFNRVFLCVFLFKSLEHYCFGRLVTVLAVGPWIMVSMEEAKNCLVYYRSVTVVWTASFYCRWCLWSLELVSL